MNKKALMNITDAIILVMLGVFLVSFVYASMNELEDKVNTRNTKAQMGEIGEYVVKGITETYLSGKNIDALHVKIVKELQIPGEINGYLYKIKLTKEYVEVYSPKLDYSIRSYLNIDEDIIAGKDIWAGEIKVVYLKEDETERIELI